MITLQHYRKGKKAWMEKHTHHSPEKWFSQKHNPWPKKERNSRAKEQTDHNGGKTRKTHTEQKLDNIHIP
jgi:hypothetical protein